MLLIPSLGVRPAGVLLGAFSLLSSAGIAQIPAVPPATSAPATQAADRPLREFLVIESVGKGGRNPLHTDAIEAAIVADRPVAPRAGDTVDLPDGSKKTWNAATVGEDGSLSRDALRGGYAFARLNSDSEQICLLNAAGHNMVYVNGEPHMGDPYSHGYVQVPIKLRRGENTFLFQVGRGSVRATVSQPAGDAVFLRGDVTCPDVEPDFTKVVRLAVPIANLTDGWLSVRCEAWIDGRSIPAQSLGVLAPRAVGKRPIEIPLAPADFERKEAEITLRLGGASADTMSLRLPVRREGVRKRTFISAIDGSVQYYAYRPGIAAPSGARPLLLSLHGASVEATGQAGSYGTQWIDVVAPTNRRPFGFDWEDWGRLDGIETLETALRDISGVDPSRVYLSGHSMGGHGTWHLGVTFPDRFAAIGPSAGWISFWSYGGMNRAESPNPIAGILQRSAAASDTLALLRNLRPMGVYILHGDADDNVPVEQAREIRTKLAEFHHDLRWHEQAGAGHWWESSKEPGAECVDWPEMMDFFARHRRPAGGEVRDVDFTTAGPGVSARCNWVTIQQQTKPMIPSRITLHCDPQTRQFSGTSENVRRFAIDLSHLSDGPIRVELDGQTLEAARPAPTAGAPSLFLLREGETWSVASAPDAAEKGPNRYGPFKTAFSNRFVLVVGTKGDAAENQWALQKARYDAETWWYRGNGCATIMTDAQYLDQAQAASDPRNVILYGNSQTNAAWPQLLGDSPVQVDRGGVRIGERSIQGENLAVLLIRPLPGNPVGSVGVVSGTGMEGFRLTERIPYFVSGVGYPDCIVLSTDCLARGVEAVRAAGYFASDWRLQGADFEFSN